MTLISIYRGTLYIEFTYVIASSSYEFHIGFFGGYLDTYLSDKVKYAKLQGISSKIL